MCLLAVAADIGGNACSVMVVRPGKSIRKFFFNAWERVVLLAEKIATWANATSSSGLLDRD
jgi:hypothetical protein